MNRVKQGINQRQLSKLRSKKQFRGGAAAAAKKRRKKEKKAYLRRLARPRPTPLPQHWGYVF
ncbi:MAG: hypothetical protein CO030_01420 [Candidatus Magasanikbacteria bacterium CG_4_9_14_0_2_um_filter_42_11]|uniref:Uncharacterized protein n=1 Tax=Candidatus Magasanikbacteria bacterium CG_4_9_14_0_2_um_filter_42_11 TaxID=1974643 RepID=A0A2M8FAE8_9BACT|nr:MAG: hypothetical protein COU34_00185 [Candidatus Magasanikbacteria bacterium CG10_big_fil_rev_8_21_14_0_10_43_9]PIY92332.1 MAG: hypothetical protein COY70_03810 [Candidatus Magasanikbacteria bacterium CG_4_10_14_0_8_um_filter_42_12]PJC52715.1 MAG: hypothetical protein CO030_01420 [Candidatus Magasanikbacteria bacterium CG_4_9_14_0_2_um_filter_42_11]